ncbi:MAG TPA: fumarylacetoacetate hydrolase family protein, partial [Gemmatimonadaceae bacterium]
IICVGRNYRAHVAEGSRQVPLFPSVFLRLASSVVAHGQPIRVSRLSSDYDYEGELAFVVGRGGRHIARERAFDHVAGYACFNEACFRDFQFKHSLTVGKNFAASGAFGPWMTTADVIPDPCTLELTTRLNGVLVQQASVSELIFDIPHLVSYLSDMTPLLPGDVIATGTPEGVGFARTPPQWLKAGDEVEVEVSRVGVLRNRVAPEE